MSETVPTVETPLHYMREQRTGDGEPGVVIREAPLLGQLKLRGDPLASGFLRAVESVMGMALPTAACTAVRNGDTAICWLGPDEWLLLVPAGRERELEREFQAQPGAEFALTSVSGGQTLLNLAGTGVPTVLKKACNYDFQPDNCGPGRCVQTNFARATALVLPREDGSWDVVVRRSFADYLARWLLDAGAEFGAVILGPTAAE